MRRLSAAERGELEHRREQLRRELHFLEAELRTDDILRLSDRVRDVESEREGRPRLAGRAWRAWVR